MCDRQEVVHLRGVRDASRPQRRVGVEIIDGVTSYERGMGEHHGIYIVPIEIGTGERAGEPLLCVFVPFLVHGWKNDSGIRVDTTYNMPISNIDCPGLSSVIQDVSLFIFIWNHIIIN